MRHCRLQTLTEIRQVLEEAGWTPRKALGQNFLIDKNLMAKVLALADPRPDRCVLEVGPGTGSLTEGLLAMGCRVVAVEIDRRLCEALTRRLAGQANLVLVCGDALAGKHAISPRVLAALGGQADMVANLPYSIATPLVADCLTSSWRSAVGGPAQGACRFDRLTFTVQREVAERLTAPPGGGQYGAISVLVALLGEVTPGPVLPATAFWPAPKVSSRTLRIDFSHQAAQAVKDLAVLSDVLHLAFGQRRKQIGSCFRRKTPGYTCDALLGALEATGVPPTLRAEQIPPPAFAAIANTLCRQP